MEERRRGGDEGDEVWRGGGARCGEEEMRWCCYRQAWGQLGSSPRVLPRSRCFAVHVDGRPTPSCFPPEPCVHMHVRMHVRMHMYIGGPQMYTAYHTRTCWFEVDGLEWSSGVYSGVLLTYVSQPRGAYCPRVCAWAQDP